MKNHIILGIESSCDDTGASIFSTQHGVQSNVVFSQTDAHRLFGGVVPEIAASYHLEKISHVVSQAFEKAGCTLPDVDAIAVTSKPGLPGSLIVGTCFAKALAFTTNKPIIGINHLEGHIFSASVEHNIPFPYVCLTVSGGHTAMYLVQGQGEYTMLGQTRDDAAGEAFDKVAKLLNIPYPGGPIIEKLAAIVGFQDFFNYPRGKMLGYDFSFSGLKTAVLYDLIERGWYDKQTKKSTIPDEESQAKVASSLLYAISDIFCRKIIAALKEFPEVRSIAFVGGVACNQYIRKQLELVAMKYDAQVYTPHRQYCTDNAAMIAYVGHYKFLQGKLDSMDLDIL